MGNFAWKAPLHVLVSSFQHFWESLQVFFITFIWSFYTLVDTIYLLTTCVRIYIYIITYPYLGLCINYYYYCYYHYYYYLYIWQDQIYSSKIHPGFLWLRQMDGMQPSGSVTRGKKQLNHQRLLIVHLKRLPFIWVLILILRTCHKNVWK